MKSTAVCAWLAAVSFVCPDIFVYKSAHAATGSNVPDWIQASCCGPQDAHKLRADQVYRNEDGSWHADGYPRPIANNVAHGSEDGNAWVFYRNDMTASGPSGVYCLFFVPSI